MMLEFLLAHSIQITRRLTPKDVSVMNSNVSISWSISFKDFPNIVTQKLFFGCHTKQTSQTTHISHRP
jgi:hypothetical protein